MGAAALEYAYRYSFASELRTAGALLALSLISRTRFFLPTQALLAADPVVTSGGERLRFEAFSVCCGVYARVDLLPQATDGIS